MKKMRKLIDLDPEVIQILDEEAKAQNRSLKSLIEKTVTEKAHRVSEPSESYKQMMDDMLTKLDQGNLKFTSAEEVLNRYEV